jgi:hypoxanthine phosphoribosyltransferase
MRPDFFARTVTEDDWLLYPWNYFEDFLELIAKTTKRIKQREPSAETLAKAISDSFGVDIPVEDLTYVLQASKGSDAERKQK